MTSRVDDAAGLLRFAHDLADLADAITLPAFRAGLEVEYKADGTEVTAADRDTELHLRRAIGRAHPGHAVLGEEAGRSGSTGAPTWIIDPIDGTRNFVTGNPVWATLIALQIDGREVLGVVSAPALGSRWDGLIDGTVRSATQDGRPIAVSGRSLAQGEVSFGGLKYFKRAGRAGAVARLSDATSRQRGFGDFWQHCLVASGAIEVAVEAEVNLWDLAAVKAVVEAAGGRFTDLEGRATADGGSAVSSNGLVHDEVLALLHVDR